MSNSLINRLVVEVGLPDAETPKVAQTEAERLIKKEIIPALELAIEAFSEQNLMVEKLEIDLGETNKSELRPLLKMRLEATFEQLLQQTEDNVYVGKTFQPEAESEKTRFKSLLFFLETGQLPWFESSAGFSSGNFDPVGLALEMLEQRGDFLKRWLPLLQQQERVRRRFASLLETDSGLQLSFFRAAGSFFPEPALQQLVHFLEKQTSAHEQLFRRQLVSAFYNWLLLPQSGSGVGSVLGQIAGLWRETGFSPGEDASQPTIYNHAFLKFLTETGIWTEQQMVGGWPSEAFWGAEESPFSVWRGDRLPEGAASSGISGVFAEETETDKPAGSSPADKRIRVANAGLVLLGPFLPAFFRETGLTDESGHWKHPASQLTAIHLLHFLCFGDSQKPFEYFLTLNKILVSWPEVQPVPLVWEPAGNLNEEAGVLVETVIKHWEALKNTSVEGFRQAFLRRNGLLEKIESGWILRTETAAWDVLLDRLPWGFSTLRFPWSTEMIFTEWKYK